MLSGLLALLILASSLVPEISYGKEELLKQNPTKSLEVKEEVLKKEEKMKPSSQEKPREELEKKEKVALEKLEIPEPKTSTEEINYNLRELRFFAKDENGVEKEYFQDPPFFQDKYLNYDVKFPRETKEIKVIAIPMMEDVEATIVDCSGYGNKPAKVKKIEPHTFLVSWDNEAVNYNDGFFFEIDIYGHPSQVGATSNVKGRYSYALFVEGYPKPQILGLKNRVFLRNSKVSLKEDILKDIKVIDELDGDITDELKVTGWQYDSTTQNKDLLWTEYLREYKVDYEVTNSHGQKATAQQIIKIVDDTNIDIVPPEFHGLSPKTFRYGEYGETITKEMLLEGVTATDDVDGDITNQITVSPENYVVEEGDSVNLLYAWYKVKDTAGNETKKHIIHKLLKVSNEKRPDLNKLLAEMSRFYYGTGDDWPVVGLSIYGKKDMVSKSTLLTKAQSVIEENKDKATEFERIAVSLTSAGFDAQNIPKRSGGTINLIEKIANFENMGSLNDYIWALLAYDSGNYTLPKNSKWTREALIDYLLNHQLSDGSWSLNSTKGAFVDVDITAMAISALAPYKDDAKVSAALDRAIRTLGSIKTSGLGYIYGPQKTETSESSSMVLIALAAMGIDPDQDSRFHVDGASIIDGLYSFMAAGNTFKHVKVATGDYLPTPNAMATEQAFRALSTYQKFQEKGYQPYHAYRFADFSKTSEKDPAVPTPEEPDKPIDPGTIVTLYDLRIQRLPYKRTYKQGEKADLTGLVVEAVYSDGSKETIDNKELTIYGLDTTTWGPRKKVLISYGGLENSFTIDVEAPENPTGTQATISVKDPKGRTYYSEKALDITLGKDTAFSLLQKTGLNYKYNYHPKYEGVYVSSIEGLAEFDGGPNSGWMYRVNGEFPNHSASLHKIYAGDKVEWLYTRDLGKDLGAKIEETDDYTITVRHNQGGTVAPSGSIQVKKNQNFTLRILPDKGYVIDRVLIDGQDRGKIESYSFYSVDKDHRVDVSFVQVKDLETKEPIKQGNKTLRDIPGHWAQGAMTYCLDKGYFAGKGDGTFGANDPVSRGDLVTVLGRRRKAQVKAEKVFKDVDPNTYYGPYVAWSKQVGIAHGYKGNFRPKDSMTREEMAKVFQDYLKAEKKLSKREKRTFKDQKKISSWAKESVDTLTSQGILVGDQKGNFNPKQTLTRAQVAQVLYQIDQQ